MFILMNRGKKLFDTVTSDREVDAKRDYMPYETDGCFHNLQVRELRALPWLL